MTKKEFIERCEDVATDISNENWDSRVVLNRIAAEIGEVTFDFTSDTDLSLDFSPVPFGGGNNA